MKFLDNRQSNSETVLSSLLKRLKVNVTPSTSKECLNKHPNFPSLLAISDCLNEWGINNEAYQVDKTSYAADILPIPFIAHLPVNKGRFILISKIENGYIHYTDEKNKHSRFEEQEFLKLWDGVILSAEVQTESGENKYKQVLLQNTLRRLLFPVATIVFFILLGSIMSSQELNWLHLLLIFIKLGGVAVSVLLLIHSINANNPLVQNLCGLAGKNDCNTILKSKASKITDWLSWSEVGFFYFAGTLLLIITVSSSLVILAWLNLLALPYTVYSFSYQFRNRNWCTLCCMVQILLITEALCFAISPIKYFDFSIEDLMLTNVFLCFALPIIIWAFLKPFFLQAAQVLPLKQQLKKFKFNSDLFKQALKNQPRYAVDNDLMPIVLGNPDAETIITMVSNPYCGPCGNAHQTLSEWMKTRKDLQFKFLFTTADDDDDARTQVARHATALSQLRDKSIVENALEDWYHPSTKYEDWILKYPVDLNKTVEDATARQKKWCELAEIEFTPTILINGFKLPDPYRLEDIKYLID
ncbi:hypothetical protein FFJ24_005750 [Pedobacter sp. KBS0701]|uniref:cysteine peptidase family C39 domain-containing protein n=1 Tax=Pedobacter sp. KBS0701 TaxID=2578106 RepID=UPI00110E45AD|nr:cysteine peptidase family C39 domain-containing protein [Pedobacter sp. KBS0701]QDW24354.1 hypothetical protein FFJ24_005750 [Pedobacter sp. KBS0701]